MSMTESHALTAKEYLEIGFDGHSELVRGELQLVRPCRSPEHGRICFNVASSLERFGRESGNGYSLVKCAILTERDPDTIRGADVSYYSRARLPREWLGPGLPDVVPDVIV